MGMPRSSGQPGRERVAMKVAATAAAAAAASAFYHPKLYTCQPPFHSLGKPPFSRFPRPSCSYRVSSLLFSKSLERRQSFKKAQAKKSTPLINRVIVRPLRFGDLETASAAKMATKRLLLLLLEATKLEGSGGALSLAHYSNF